MKLQSLEVLDQLSNCWLTRKDYATWNKMGGKKGSNATDNYLGSFVISQGRSQPS